MKKAMNKQIGFTLVETMVSVSIFIVIVMMGMTSLLNANLLQQKSSDMRSIIDNLSFIMDEMSNNLRTGTNYYCITVTPLPVSVPDSYFNTVPTSSDSNSCYGVAFLDQSPHPQMYYIGTYSDSGKSGVFESSGGTDVMQLTPDEVNIDAKSSFIVSGAQRGSVPQAFVTIKLVGTITSKGITTPFSLQTSVSQRKPNI